MYVYVYTYVRICVFNSWRRMGYLWENNVTRRRSNRWCLHISIYAYQYACMYIYVRIYNICIHIYIYMCVGVNGWYHWVSLVVQLSQVVPIHPWSQVVPSRPNIKCIHRCIYIHMYMHINIRVHQNRRMSHIQWWRKHMRKFPILVWIWPNTWLGWT